MTMRDVTGVIQLPRLFPVSVLEQDRLARINTSGVTPEHIYEYLPFAIALDVREAWGDNIADAFLAAEVSH
jgi:hypothetical protein